MKKRIWGLVQKRFVTEKGIQDFIVEGFGMALTVIGVIVFLLILTAVKRNLGI